ncbi:MAG: hypothetical protein IPF81_04130 [Bacteroidetes bacterium]|nr:hypothetical protein [Bacteroidota bacterium]
MAYPQLSVRTNTINGNDITTVIDTLKALKESDYRKYSMTGAKQALPMELFTYCFDKWVTMF